MRVAKMVPVCVLSAAMLIGPSAGAGAGTTIFDARLVGVDLASVGTDICADGVSGKGKIVHLGQLWDMSCW